MSITLAFVIILWYLSIAAGWFFLGWQAAALIFLGSTFACIVMLLLDMSSDEEEDCEEEYKADR